MIDDPLISKNSGDGHQQGATLAEVVLMTEEMLICAKSDAWDAVTELEEKRRIALAKCFSTPVPIGQSELFSEALAAMLHMNEELISLLEVAKQNVAVKRTDQRHTKRSLGHYLDVEKDH